MIGRRLSEVYRRIECVGRMGLRRVISGRLCVLQAKYAM